MINAGVALPGAGYPGASPSAGYTMPSGVPQSNTTSVVPSGTTGLPMSPTSTTTKPAEFSGAATKVAGGAGALLVAAFAFVL